MNIRHTTLVDIEEICELQSSCFSSGDSWDRYTYLKYINNSLVIEIDNKIVSVLIQGYITPSGVPSQPNERNLYIFSCHFGKLVK